MIPEYPTTCVEMEVLKALPNAKYLLKADYFKKETDKTR
jgi:hypothetical protein